MQHLTRTRMSGMDGSSLTLSIPSAPMDYGESTPKKQSATRLPQEIC